MNISDVFDRSCVKAQVKVGSKKTALQSIATLIFETGAFPGYSAKQLYRELDDRERSGSTGFENGVALPHTALPDAERFVAGLLTVPEGVSFDSLDGEDAQLLFFVIGPSAKRNDHIQIISAISRAVVEAESREQLLRAETDEQLFDLVREAFDSGESAEAGSRSMFHIFVQKPEPFDDLLTIFSAAVPGSLCVLEGTNAGSYFNRLPIFSGFWTDAEDSYFKVIVAVVDEARQNDIIRRINTIVDDIGESPGVLITVQQLSYASGSLQF